MEDFGPAARFRACGLEVLAMLGIKLRTRRQGVSCGPRGEAQLAEGIAPTGCRASGFRRTSRVSRYRCNRGRAGGRRRGRDSRRTSGTWIYTARAEPFRLSVMRLRSRRVLPSQSGRERRDCSTMTFLTFHCFGGPRHLSSSPSLDRRYPIGDLCQRFRYLDEDEELSVLIADGPSNPDIGLINQGTPVARGLLGRRVGENCEISLPIGKRPALILHVDSRH